MRTPKIYLETTIFNFYFADDAPDKKADTLKLFQEIKAGKYEPFTSAYVLDEIKAAPEPKQTQLSNLIKEYNLAILPASSETKKLATIYVDEGIIPRKYLTDALHIAVATINNLDYIVSYNFRHIVKLKTVTMTEIINLREHYKKIGIFSPTEVIENDD
ncbi:MAG: type II toxin-antitoxin system VapC family toxin [Candidatus Margulisbacteria bacterium]|jgi:predicted nucleic acid-binding protein|nr:type II toxin-antitoxin system VapC family toxin [Candidatus Margulisiibacteriota bacterium]